MNTQTRLERLEKRMIPDPLIVIAKLPNGETAQMTVSEMLQRGAGFCKVVSGSDMNDLDRILATIPGGAR